MTKFWTSWYSGNYADEGCTKPPFKFWVSGYRDRPNCGLNAAQYAQYTALTESSTCTEEDEDDFLEKHSRDDCTICAMIEAVDENAVWLLVNQHFPDYQQRFCEAKEADFDPSVGGRFL